MTSQYKILLPQGWEWALDVRGADTAVILRNICQYTSSYISHKYLSTELCHPQTSGLSWISQSNFKSLYWITRLCLHIILKKEYKNRTDRNIWFLDKSLPCCSMTCLVVNDKTFHCWETKTQRDTSWHEAKIMDTNGIN